MSQEHNNSHNNSHNNWRPNTDIKTLKQRANIIAKIRDFFSKRGVLEIDTPLMAHAPVTDPYLEALKVNPISHPNKTLYLQTSPEYAMKRLLAANSGCIYQICKAFRDEPTGPLHNMEFTMLEWYRVNFNYTQLIQEITELLKILSNWPDAKIQTYQELFEYYLDINPHIISYEKLLKISEKNKCYPIKGLNNPSADDLLMLLFSKVIEPDFANKSPVFAIDYPASQAALANIISNNISNNISYKISQRFELYYKGFELANGYDELTDKDILLTRFYKDLEIRKKLNLPNAPIDYKLIASMQNGKFPKCSGVALGLDRLIALLLEKKDIREVNSF
jgi:elongation factor P--(R)-beta-lysine ligase